MQPIHSVQLGENDIDLHQKTGNICDIAKQALCHTRALYEQPDANSCGFYKIFDNLIREMQRVGVVPESKRTSMSQASKNRTVSKDLMGKAPQPRCAPSPTSFQEVLKKHKTSHNHTFNKITKTRPVKARVRKSAPDIRKDGGGTRLVREQGEGAKADDKQWPVEKIVAHRGRKKKREYRIRWVGFTSDDDTWEPSENVSHDLIDPYEDSLSPSRALT